MMKLINELKRYADMYQNPKGARGREIIGTAELLIAAADALEKAQSQWIPVTERLPEERQPVYIRLDNGNVFRAEIRTRELLKEWWYCYDGTEDMDMLGTIYEVEKWLKFNPVVEWMPLPEPCCHSRQNGEEEIECEIPQPDSWLDTV